MSNINFTYPDEPQQNIVEVRFNSTKEGDKGDKGDKGERGPRGYGITRVAPISISTASGGKSDYGVYGKDDEGNEIIYTQFSVYNGKDVTAQELPIIGTEPITVNIDADNNYVIGFDNSYAKLATIEGSDTISAAMDGSVWRLDAHIYDYPVSFVNDNGDQFGSFTLNQVEPGTINITNHIIGTGSMDIYQVQNTPQGTMPVKIGTASNSLLVGTALSATQNNCLIIGNDNTTSNRGIQGAVNPGGGYLDCAFVIGRGFERTEDINGKVTTYTVSKNTFVVDASGSIYCDMAFGDPVLQQDEVYEDVAFTKLVFDMMNKINEIVEAVNGLRPGQTQITTINLLDYMGFRVGWSSSANKESELHHIIQRSNNECTICHKDF